MILLLGARVSALGRGGRETSKFRLIGWLICAIISTEFRNGRIQRLLLSERAGVVVHQIQDSTYQTCVLKRGIGCGRLADNRARKR